MKQVKVQKAQIGAVQTSQAKQSEIFTTKKEKPAKKKIVEPSSSKTKKQANVKSFFDANVNRTPNIDAQQPMEESTGTIVIFMFTFFIK